MFVDLELTGGFSRQKSSCFALKIVSLVAFPIVCLSG